MGENASPEVIIISKEVDAAAAQAFEDWAKITPAKEPYWDRYPEDTGLEAMREAFMEGVRWAIFNIET